MRFILGEIIIQTDIKLMFFFEIPGITQSQTPIITEAFPRRIDIFSFTENLFIRIILKFGMVGRFKIIIIIHLFRQTDAGTQGQAFPGFPFYIEVIGNSRISLFIDQIEHSIVKRIFRGSIPKISFLFEFFQHFTIFSAFPPVRIEFHILIEGSVR